MRAVLVFAVTLAFWGLGVVSGSDTCTTGVLQTRRCARGYKNTDCMWRPCPICKGKERNWRRYCLRPRFCEGKEGGRCKYQNGANSITAMSMAGSAVPGCLTEQSIQSQGCFANEFYAITSISYEKCQEKCYRDVWCTGVTYRDGNTGDTEASEILAQCPRRFEGDPRACCTLLYPGLFEYDPDEVTATVLPELADRCSVKTVSGPVTMSTSTAQCAGTGGVMSTSASISQRLCQTEAGDEPLLMTFRARNMIACSQFCSRFPGCTGFDLTRKRCRIHFGRLSEERTQNSRRKRRSTCVIGNLNSGSDS